MPRQHLVARHNLQPQGTEPQAFPSLLRNVVAAPLVQTERIPRMHYCLPTAHRWRRGKSGTDLAGEAQEGHCRERIKARERRGGNSHHPRRCFVKQRCAKWIYNEVRPAFHLYRKHASRYKNALAAPSFLPHHLGDAHTQAENVHSCYGVGLTAMVSSLRSANLLPVPTREDARTLVSEAQTGTHLG